MKLRHFSYILILLLQVELMAQAVKDIHPEIGELIELSDQGEQEFYELEERCEALWDKMDQGHSESELSVKERLLYDTCMIDRADYWSAEGIGCSWYCGGGPYQVSASSVLDGQNGFNYQGLNAHDLSFKTAWVEGVTGYGLGEYLTYEFAPTSPRITKVIIANGYVRNEKLWRENARVKKLEVLLDNETYAILHLEDTKAKQYFDVGVIGHSERKDFDKLEAAAPWVLTFKILEVYPGERFDDTVITEIFFDGIDVH